MRILRKKEVAERVGYSSMQIWRLEKADKFPRRVTLGPAAVGWVESEVDDWIAAKVAERDAELAARKAAEAEDAEAAEAKATRIADDEDDDAEAEAEK